MAMSVPSSLFCFGLGYTAQVLARRLGRAGWEIGGSVRAPVADVPSACRCVPFDREHRLDAQAFSRANHILVSVPPDAAGDPVLDVHGQDIAASPSLRWLGYLSTTGVYGDRGGGWVDERSELRPSGERGRRRVAAEAGWLALWRERGVPVHVFRLAGIYGPGRSPFGAFAMAPRSASTSPARSLPASMSRTSRRCW